MEELIEVKQHLSRLLEAVAAEQQQEQVYYETIAQEKTVKQHVEEGLAVFPLRYVRYYYTVGDMIEIEYEQTGNLESRNKLNVGAGVQIMQNNGQALASGILSYRRKTSYKVLLHPGAEIDDSLRGSGAVAICMSYDPRPYKVMQSALNEVLLNLETKRIKPLVDGIYLGKNLTHLGNSTDESIPDLETGSSGINTSQRDAINQASKSYPYYIIHGPPGTGKTTTIIQLLKRLTEKEKSVLVCAASNNAVDLLAERSAEADMSVVRVGNVARISDKLMHLTLNEKVRNHEDWTHLKKVKIEAEEAQRQAKKFKRTFGPEERQQRNDLYAEARELRKWAKQLENKLVETILDNAQIIASTLIGVEHEVLKGRAFKTVIIDEASQSLEPEVWVALLKAERIILVGDHCQLPPTVKSNAALDLGLQATLFDRLIKRQHQQSLLNTQYRMHEKILAFSNEKFYGGKLQSGQINKNHTLDADQEPLVFIDTSGTGFEEEMHKQHKSFRNPGEFLIMREHMLAMLERLAGHSIGVISPYKEQVRYISDQIPQTEELRQLDIQVDSIDGFQGQEKDVIYLSLVRSNDQQNIGFLMDERRLNVAMTRARKKLIIIGDSATLASAKLYRALLDHIESSGSYKSAWEYMSY